MLRRLLAISTPNIALNCEFDTLAAGHLTRVGTPADIRTQGEYLANVRRACIDARSSVSPATIAQRTGTLDKWRFVSAYFDELARRSAATVIPNWSRRLGGVAAFTHSHCIAMTIALAHEWGVDASNLSEAGNHGSAFGDLVGHLSRRVRTNALSQSAFVREGGRLRHIAALR
jgi:hypothetical protein